VPLPHFEVGELFVTLALSIILVITSVLTSVVEKNLDRITIVVGGLWFSGVVALSLVLKSA